MRYIEKLSSSWWYGKVSLRLFFTHAARRILGDNRLDRLKQICFYLRKREHHA